MKKYYLTLAVLFTLPVLGMEMEIQEQAEDDVLFELFGLRPDILQSTTPDATPEDSSDTTIQEDPSNILVASPKKKKKKRKRTSFVIPNIFDSAQPNHDTTASSIFDSRFQKKSEDIQTSLAGLLQTVKDNKLNQKVTAKKRKYTHKKTTNNQCSFKDCTRILHPKSRPAHKDWHEGLFQHTCDEHQLAFKTPLQLTLHQKNIIHKKHSCAICSKRFNSKAHKEFCERKHALAGTFFCKTCGATFKNNDGLIVHEKNVSHDSIIPCLHCKESFLSQAAKNQHKQEKHPETVRHSKKSALS